MSKRKSRTSKNNGGNFFLRLFKWLIILALWGGMIGGGVIAWYAKDLPAITQDAVFDRKSSITIKAADGSVLAIYGEMRDGNVEIGDLPPELVKAVLAIEDRRFYSHFGIDPIGLARAVVTNLFQGRVSQGGSTITQQLAKNMFLSHERTYERKIQEALLAVWLERNLSKDDILAAYLNRVYFGSGAYGVKAAAKLYFDKDIKDINLQESATLAGVLKAPSRYSPLRNPHLARERAHVVLQAMVDAGYIDSTQAGELSKIPPAPSNKPLGAGGARFYADWVLDGLDDLIGSPSEDLIIQTTLNPRIQNNAERVIAEMLGKYGEEKGASQAAAVVMRPDGAVVAMVGGADYMTSQFNRITQAKRQPGSSFKPIVYLTALENGWRQNTIVLDAPIEEGKYRPKNFGNKYMGSVTLETALTNSLNTAAVRITEAVTPQRVSETARRLGIISRMDPVPSIALGSNVLSPLELTTAYAVIANSGLSVYPYAITRITDKNGQLYYERRADRLTRRVVSRTDTGALRSMMRSVVENGTGRGAQLSVPVAGKTGTSQDSRDAWFAGFTGELVSVVWYGNDDNSPMKGVTGGSLPAQTWRQIMAPAVGIYPSMNSSDFSPSEGIDSLLNRLVGSNIPSVGRIPDFWEDERKTDNNSFSYRRENSSQGETEHEENKRYND